MENSIKRPHNYSYRYQLLIYKINQFKPFHQAIKEPSLKQKEIRKGSHSSISRSIFFSLYRPPQLINLISFLEDKEFKLKNLDNLITNKVSK